MRPFAVLLAVLPVFALADTTTTVTSTTIMTSTITISRVIGTSSVYVQHSSTAPSYATTTAESNAAPTTVDDDSAASHLQAVGAIIAGVAGMIAMAAL